MVKGRIWGTVCGEYNEIEIDECDAIVAIGQITVSLEEYKTLIENKIRMDILRDMYKNDNYPDQDTVRRLLSVQKKESKC